LISDEIAILCGDPAHTRTYTEAFELPEEAVMMLKMAIPEIHVTNSLAAKEFYSTILGFTCVSSWRPDETKDDPCYMVFVRDGVRLHVTSFQDVALGTSVYVYVDDPDALHAEFARKGVERLGPVVDQTWKTREFGIADPDQNRIRFGQDTSGNST
jgi:catechol 2,3-dioxygenase-like lactoylglutathione lyase family enzyme